MEKDNTDDLFKKILDNPPPMRPSMEAMEDMNSRLDAVKDKRKGVPWWWLLPLLLLPFLFSSIFFYLKYQTATKTINDLNLQLTDNQSNILKDTLIESITVYHYDTVLNTIYQEVIIKRNRKEPAALIAGNSNVFSNSALPNFAFNDFKKSIFDKNNTFDKSSIQPSQLELLRDGKVLSLGQMAAILNNNNENELVGNPSDRNVENLLVADVEKLSFLDNRFHHLHPLPPSDHFLNLTSKTDVDKINPLWYFIPTGFKAGFNRSPIGIANLPGSSNTLKSVGFLGEVEFTKNTRLQFGLDYLSVPLKAESSEELSQFPPAMPDDPNDLFKEIYGDFTYLQVPFTFKYVFQPDKKWKPSIGIGMIARLPLKEQFRYEFVSVQGGEYKRNLPYNDGSFSIKNLSGSVGLDYNFYKNFSIQAEGFYNYQFGQPTNPYFNLRYGGLNLGLKYKLL